MNNEIWKDVRGFEGYYQVSNLGNVFSLIKNRQMKVTINKRGYGVLMLCGAMQRINKRVHILVAECFVDNPENKPQVNHKDGNKQNNYFENLEWNTPLENMHHAINTGLLDFSKIKYRNGKKKKL